MAVKKKVKNKRQAKPRDPFVQHLISKKSGAHQKAYKIDRRNSKIFLRKSTNYS